MIFKTTYNIDSKRNASGSTPAGSPVRIKYAYNFDSDGERVLVPVEKIDMYERTQMSKPDDLYTLLKNCGVDSSDSRILFDLKQVINNDLQDFASMPRNLIEAHDVIHRVQDKFDCLPVDVKQAFNNNPNVFLNSFVDGSIDNRLKNFIKSDVVEEVSKNE